MTTHRVDPLAPGTTVCCAKPISSLPGTAKLAFADGVDIDCPNVTSGDNLHLAIANLLGVSPSNTNKALLALLERRLGGGTEQT